MIYPFRCKPIYKEKIWGGRWFEEGLARKLPDNKLIGESWELSCRPDEMSEVLNGSLAGKTIAELIHLHPEDLLGDRVISQGIDPFPLLIKFLDAKERLSVQVHPNNAYMTAKGTDDLGKSELWYVLSAEPDARLVIGVKEGVTPEIFEQGILHGNLDEYLTEVTVKPGDTFYIPAGTVHAIMEGVRIAEIQQNSDTTFRIYDWNRLGLDGRPRDLHIKEALEMIDFNCNDAICHEGILISGNGWQRHLITICEYFAVEELLVENYGGKVNPERFEVWMVVEGSGELVVQGEKYQLSLGETWFIPAVLGSYHLTGEIKILRSYIPDIFSEIVKPLLEMGYTIKDLWKIGGFEGLKLNEKGVQR